MIGKRSEEGQAERTVKEKNRKGQQKVMGTVLPAGNKEGLLLVSSRC